MSRRNPVVSDEALINMIKLHHKWYVQPETYRIFQLRHYNEPPIYNLENAFPQSSSKASYTALVQEARARKLQIPDEPVHPFVESDRTGNNVPPKSLCQERKEKKT